MAAHTVARVLLVVAKQYILTRAESFVPPSGEI
jgi:hypothetical protein